MSAILSGDTPRSRILSLALILIVLGLYLVPFLFPGQKPLDTAAKIVVFIVLVASYDLLLGYTGIVSFAHTMFFGLGAYGTAIGLTQMGPSFLSILIGGLAGVAVAVLFAVVIGLFSLRVRALFFAMVTLAVASAFAVLVSQLSAITGGEDGLNLTLPRELTPGFRLFTDRIFGLLINGRVLAYYGILLLASLFFLVMLRIVNSPYGSVLKAIRENAFRAEAIGYNVVAYRTMANALGAAFAALAGVLLAVWLRYTGPATTLSSEIMVDVLLMVVIGGMGTLYGAIVGVTLFILAQNYLQNLMRVASEALIDLPFLPKLVHPDRWLLWLGLLFILSVYFFPTGIVGRLRQGKDEPVHRPAGGGH